MALLADKAYGHQMSALLIKKCSWFISAACSNSPNDGTGATRNVSVMWQHRDISQQQCSTVLCTLVSFVLLVIHLGSPPLPLLFLKATVAFTGSADRMS